MAEEAGGRKEGSDWLWKNLERRQVEGPSRCGRRGNGGQGCGGNEGGAQRGGKKGGRGKWVSVQ